MSEDHGLPRDDNEWGYCDDHECGCDRCPPGCPEMDRQFPTDAMLAVRDVSITPPPLVESRITLADIVRLHPVNVYQVRALANAVGFVGGLAALQKLGGTDTNGLQVLNDGILRMTQEDMWQATPQRQSLPTIMQPFVEAFSFLANRVRSATLQIVAVVTGTHILTGYWRRQRQLSVPALPPPQRTILEQVEE